MRYYCSVLGRLISQLFLLLLSTTTSHLSRERGVRPGPSLALLTSQLVVATVGLARGNWGTRGGLSIGGRDVLVEMELGLEGGKVGLVVVLAVVRPRVVGGRTS